MSRPILAVVSNSTGKDSGITIELAIEAHGRENVRIAFADTGNEHELVYEHLEHQRALYGEIIELRADFTSRIAKKREYVSRVWTSEGVPEHIVANALSILHPTGVPYLDLCLWKGRFPSRKAQFCTQELKRIPLDNYMLGLMGDGFDVESWRGMRRDESENRRHAVEREQAAEGWTVVHPIVDWTADQVIAEHRRRGLKLNPLYSRGMTRVGCMPCINCSKDELLEISKRFPQHIGRIREWERLVALAAKRGWTTFFTDGAIESRSPRAGWKYERRTDDEGTEYDAWIEPDASIYARCNVDARVQWAQTARGGRQTDFIRLEEPEQCSSVYGLCE
jgi:3'-phosphoadenosine 5'-phosphosulfate sulfotransferase (PAPS reductase)/FAD synthetase